ncbi:radical SAM protein [Candidatus Omnitrophota bacterium]
MKILFINPLDKRYGSTYRSRNIVKALTGLGHEVKYVESNLDESLFNGDISIIQKDNLWGYFIATCKRLHLVLKTNFDILYIQKFIPLSAPCLIIGKLKGKKCIVDWDDLDFCFQKNIIRKAIVFLSEHFFPYFSDLITTHSQRLQVYAHKRWIHRVEIVNQIVDLDKVNIGDSEKDELRLKIGAAGKKVLCFLGTLTSGGARDLDVIIKTVGAVAKDRSDVFFLIIGGGPLEGNFSRMLAQHGLADSSHITGLIPHQEVKKFLSISGLGSVFMRDDLGNRMRVSFKVLEYLSAGIPVIGKLVGETHDRLAQFCHNVDLEHSDSVNQIIKLLDETKAISFVSTKEYSLERAKRALSDLFQDIAKKNSITKRVDLNLGYSCNADCPFCYYKTSKKSRLKDKDLTTDQAKKLIRYIKRRGKEIIDFTGGEPTIRDDIFELVSYAKNLGFRELSIISNGLKLTDRDFLRRLMDSGINDFLFSLHGHNQEAHDKLTGVKGSFEKIKQAIRNVKESGRARIRSNTVVNGMNYDHTLEITEILYSLGVQRVNFILFNPIVEATCADEKVNVKYSQAAPSLKRVIDDYKDKFERITIRYLPFCLLPGYEHYITECPQIQYDPFEWDYSVRMRIRNGIIMSSLATIMGMMLLPNLKRILNLPLHDLLREAIMRGLSLKNKSKGKDCKRCKFDYICDGLWKEYARNFGFSELRLQKGNKIADPNYYLCLKQGNK